MYIARLQNSAKFGPIQPLLQGAFNFTDISEENGKKILIQNVDLRVMILKKYSVCHFVSINISVNHRQVYRSYIVFEKKQLIRAHDVG